MNHIQAESYFVAEMLQLEQELGCTLFLDRAAHCNFWSLRVYYPVWEKGAVEKTLHYALRYTEDITEEQYAKQLEAAQLWLREAVADLKENQMTLRQKKLEELRKQMKQLEMEIRGNNLKETLENGQA